MTKPRDLDTLLNAYLADGMDVLPDRVVDAVLDEAHRTKQRAGFGLWRTRSMYKTALGAAAAVALLVLGAGLWLGGTFRDSSVARPSVSVPTTAATPSLAPSASPDPRMSILRNGPILVVDEGQYGWIDPLTGADSTAAGLPRLQAGVDDAAWSRDGRRLAIVVRGDLEVVDPSTVDRGRPARCADLGWVCDVEGERGRSIDWSPDGGTIAASSESGLLVIDVSTGTVTTILEGSNISHPSWSPNGRTIAFEYSAPYEGRYVGALREIQLIERDGSNRRPLSGPPEPESIGFSTPFWSPDGTRIVYLGSEPWKDTGDTATDGWALSVRALNLADGQLAGPPVKLVDVGTMYCLGFCPSIILGPDGKSVLIDNGSDLVIAGLDTTKRNTLGLSARILAWRPVR
jgi:hypothetical protein